MLRRIPIDKVTLCTASVDSKSIGVTPHCTGGVEKSRRDGDNLSWVIEEDGGTGDAETGRIP